MGNEDCTVTIGDPSWITATVTSFDNNKGYVVVGVSPAVNPEKRSGTVNIGGRTFAVFQQGVACQLLALNPSTKQEEGLHHTTGKGSISLAQLKKSD